MASTPLRACRRAARAGRRGLPPLASLRCISSQSYFGQSPRNLWARPCRADPIRSSKRVRLERRHQSPWFNKDLLKEHNSNLAHSLLGETTPPTGMPSSWQHAQDESETFQPMFKYVVITNCDVLAQTMYNLCLWNEALKSSGAELGLGRVVSLGKKLGSKLTVKIPERNGSMDIWIKLTLSSMNSGVPLTLPICSDGLIGTHVEWKTRVDQCHCAQRSFGSRQTWTPACGIQMWTRTLEML